MPFAGYESFDACVEANRDKENPEAYCGSLEATLKVIHKAEPRRYTLGIVYEPNIPDAHGDFMTPETIERAAHDYMRKLQGSDDATKAATDLMVGIAKALDDDVTVRVDVGSVLEIAKAGLNDMHHNTDSDDALGEVVESFVAPADMTIDGEHVSKGSWLVGVVWNAEMFSKIQSGERTGYSLEGLGIRESNR